MAKKSKIARNEQRKVVVDRYAAKRAELKKALVDPTSTDEQREAARVGLQKLPKNASPVRVRSRDVIDGRPRGVLTKFGISRVRFRDMAHRGELPGVTKSSSLAPDIRHTTYRSGNGANASLPGRFVVSRVG
jgi:small subunit ribosomal protein S14